MYELDLKQILHIDKHMENIGQSIFELYNL